MKMIGILRNKIFFAILIGVTFLPAPIMAHGVDLSNYSDDGRPDKAGILVVAIVPKDVSTAGKQELMDIRIKNNFPGMDVRWSYFEIEGEPTEAFIDRNERISIKKSLNQMEEDRFTHVAILPLTIIPSKTYTRLIWIVNELRKMPTKFRKISLARPFFGAPKDIRNTCQTVLNILPGHEKTNEAVVLYFEEQSRLGDYIYPGVQYYFWQLDESVFIGTAGTTPGMNDVLHSLKNTGSTDVYLVPFLPYQTPSLAKWKSTLENNGYRVKQIKESVIGQKEALDVMISRLKEAIDELGLKK